MLSTFTAHRSPNHKSSTLEDFRPELLAHHTLSVSVLEEVLVPDPEDIFVSETESGLENVKAIQHQLGTLFLHMQTLLYVSNSAVQEITDELLDIGELAHQHIESH